MRRYSEEEKLEVLSEVESLGNIHLVCRKHGIPHTTVYHWIKKGAIKDKKSYVSENKKLKKKVSKLELEKSILKDLLKKTHQVF